jgi:glycerol kinase
MVAALGAGLATITDIEKIELKYDEYSPRLSDEEREKALKTWRKALATSRMKDR